MPVACKGTYVSGASSGERLWSREPRRQTLIDAFGFPLLGTFNVRVPGSRITEMQKLRPAAKVKSWNKGKPTVYRFWTAELSIRGNGWPVWLFLWHEPVSDKYVNLEFMSRERVPDAFKGPLTVQVFEKWDKLRIDRWIASWPKIFQTFPWSAPRGDSKLVWEAIGPRVEWRGRRVLDIGCHTGFHSFAAMRAGAIAVGVEVSDKIRARAREVSYHIESLPLRIEPIDPGGVWDTILYLSVHHQADPRYEHLKETIAGLKGRCSDLFVELIAPSIKGKVSAEAIDSMVGGKPFLEYEHRIRGRRRLYHLKGAP